MIYLASQSPRRRELLEQIGISHKVIKVDIDENPLPDETPEDYVVRIASEKARAAFTADMQQPLLAADTTVTCNGQILGKPANQADFVNMMQLLSGKTHEVLTAIAVTASSPNQTDGIKTITRLSRSKVSFRALSEKEILNYWENGEPRDKAGGYGIQGLGAVFIKHIQGSYSGIMGLPLYETAELLSEFGVYSI